jgi:hypothetical protein
MGWARAAVGLVAVLVAGALLVSGDSGTDPETPAGLPGLPPPFLGVAVLGDGNLTAAVDAYGDVVDLRSEPAGRALIENSSGRQAAGTVPADTGIQPWVQVGGEELPMWRADKVRQRYLPGTSVLRTEARFGRDWVGIDQAVHEGRLAVAAMGANASTVRLRVNAGGGTLTRSPGVIAAAAASDRLWLARRKPLGGGAPAWARRMYGRSLLVLRALTDCENGAVAAGARDGWAYVWPRDAAATAIAYAKAGYRPEAELSTRFLFGLELEQAARFHGDGSPVPGRSAQGDAIGWVAAAAKAAGLIGSESNVAKILGGGSPIPWRDRADYWEGEPGDYLGNAISARTDVSEFSRHIWGENSDTPWGLGLVRVSGDSESGLDPAAGWAVRPFSQPRLYPAVRATLNRLNSQGTPYGITPGEAWPGGGDPWSAPTAWTAWSLAALGERHEALRLMGALRRSATPAGDLPERTDAETGVPRSTTPLAWSHAFAILALRQLWPND